MNAFHRLEYKYYITVSDAGRILEQIQPYVRADAYGDETGKYTISSIYYDDPQYSCYYQTIDREIFRQKLRLRSYGGITNADGTCYFEIKSKFDGKSIKRRVKMPYNEAVSLAAQSLDALFISAVRTPDELVKGEVSNLINTKRLEPMSVVSYERQALIALDRPDLRITFDSGLRVRRDRLDLLAGTDGEPTMPDDMLVLEVKQNSSVPLWLARILSSHLCRNVSYSKYCSMDINTQNAEKELVNAAAI